MDLSHHRLYRYKHRWLKFNTLFYRLEIGEKRKEVEEESE